MRSLIILSALLVGCLSHDPKTDTQYVKTVRGGGQYQYMGGDNLVRFYNNTQSGYGATSNATQINQRVGICYVEVPTASLARDPKHVPAGNGSRSDLSRIETCCKGYVRNIHNFHLCDPVCPNDCVNGLCIAPNTCACFPDHVQNLAGYCVATCPIGCQNGHCAGGECLCKEGFQLDRNGKFCVPRCRENCAGIGNCTAPNTCSCQSGYHSTPEGSCRPGAQIVPTVIGSSTISGPTFHSCGSCINGECIRNECRCHPGYLLYKGECMALCNPSCGPNTWCVAPNTCSSTPKPNLNQSNNNLNQFPNQYPQYPYPNQPQNNTNNGLYPNHYPQNQNHSNTVTVHYPYPSNGQNLNGQNTLVLSQYPNSPTYNGQYSQGQNQNNQYHGFQQNRTNEFFSNQSQSHTSRDDFTSTRYGQLPNGEPNQYPFGQIDQYLNQRNNSILPHRDFFSNQSQSHTNRGDITSTQYGQLPNGELDQYPYGQIDQYLNQRSNSNLPHRGLSLQPSQEHLYPDLPRNEYPSHPNQGNNRTDGQIFYQNRYNPLENLTFNLQQGNQEHTQGQGQYGSQGQHGQSQFVSQGQNGQGQYAYQGQYASQGQQSQGVYVSSGQYGQRENVSSGQYGQGQYVSNRQQGQVGPYGQQGQYVPQGQEQSLSWNGQVPQCTQPCLNGNCVGPNRCECFPGYNLDQADPTGTRCLPHCPGGCHNGYCSAPNTCLCMQGYHKDFGVKGRPVCVKRDRRSIKPVNVAELLEFEIPDY